VYAPADAEAVRLDHLSFSYAGQHGAALRDVSLTVRRGEMVVIMGATGAGKTTLAKCLNRIVPAFQAGNLSGGIAILGRPLREEGVADLAGVVGLVSQDFEAQLFATNVGQEVVFGMEQLGVPPEQMRERVPSALSAVGLRGFDQRDPATLSGGEKQRLAIAATLALQPAILVFDEPTTDLDPLGKLEIFAVLAAMRRQGYTLIVIEHEIAAAERADRLIVMSAGRIVADDAPHRVLTQVDFLEAHGVRAPDVSRIAARLHLDPPPNDVDSAEAAIRARVRAGAQHAVPPHPEMQRRDGDVALVEAEAVEYRYDSGTRALDGVSLRIRPGEFLAVIGQNGSGKTTLAKHLNGLLRPAAGRVLFNGRDMRGLPINRVASAVGYVFQNPDHQIFAATVYDEVAFGPRNFGLPAEEVAARVKGALDAVGLCGLEQEDPFLFGKGHRQRLAVASLLALRPRLLILDEPTTGLDYLEQRRMMDLLAALHREGMAILIITHSPWVVAEYAQRGVLMVAGRVLFDGPLRVLFAQTALLEQAHFVAPDVTRLGLRFGLTPLSVEEFVSQIRGQGLEAGGWGSEESG
jgi:energy-coupling factor transporter ATP-binding protein EcfA2